MSLLSVIQIQGLFCSLGLASIYEPLANVNVLPFRRVEKPRRRATRRDGPVAQKGENRSAPAVRVDRLYDVGVDDRGWGGRGGVQSVEPRRQMRVFAIICDMSFTSLLV